MIRLSKTSHPRLVFHELRISSKLLPSIKHIFLSLFQLLTTRHCKSHDIPTFLQVYMQMHCVGSPSLANGVPAKLLHHPHHTHRTYYAKPFLRRPQNRIDIKNDTNDMRCVTLADAAVHCLHSICRIGREESILNGNSANQNA